MLFRSLQDTKNRQNSIENHNEIICKAWENSQNYIIKTALETYENAIQNGIAKEQARAILPEGLTKSRMYMKGSIRSWIHYIQIRSGIETQKEHREVALACAEAIAPIFPMIKEFVNE